MAHPRGTSSRSLQGKAQYHDGFGVLDSLYLPAASDSSPSRTHSTLTLRI